MGRRTFREILDGPANAITVNKDGTRMAVVGRNVFKIYKIETELQKFEEALNLRPRNVNLNCSANDIAWSHVNPSHLATGATNGAVCVWDVESREKEKTIAVFSDHKRTVNTINFHPVESALLVSCSQDGTMKLFDIRMSEKRGGTFKTGSDSVRDLQFSPHSSQRYYICSVAENGNVTFWDWRRWDRPVNSFTAHNGPVFSCDWHHSETRWLATAGRDRCIKIWDMDLILKQGSDTPITPEQIPSDMVQSGDVRKVSKSHSGDPETKRSGHAQSGQVQSGQVQSGHAQSGKFVKRSRSAGYCHYDPLYSISTIAPVARVRWRPGSRWNIGSSSLVVDFSVNVWDVRRSHLPVGTFEDHKDVTKGFVWVNSTAVLSAGKDNSIYHHFFDHSVMLSHTSPASFGFTHHHGTIVSSAPDPQSRHLLQRCFDTGVQVPSSSSSSSSSQQRPTPSSYQSLLSASISGSATATNYNQPSADDHLLMRTSSGSREFLSTTYSRQTPSLQTPKLVSNFKGSRDDISSTGEKSCATSASTLIRTTHGRSSSLIEPSVSGNQPTLTSSSSPPLHLAPSLNQTPKLNQSKVNQTPTYQTPTHQTLGGAIISQTRNFLEKIVTKPSAPKTSVSLEKKNMPKETLEFRSAVFYQKVPELALDWFKNLASNYELCGKSLDDLCEHNADVTYRVSKKSISMSWKLVRMLHGENVPHRSDYLTDALIKDHFGERSESAVEASETNAELRDPNLRDANLRDANLRDTSEEIKVRTRMPSSVCSRFVIKHPFPDEVINEYFSDSHEISASEDLTLKDLASEDLAPKDLASEAQQFIDAEKDGFQHAHSLDSHVIVDSFKEETVKELIKEGLIKEGKISEKLINEELINEKLIKKKDATLSVPETFQCVISFFDISPSLLDVTDGCCGSSLHGSFSDLREEAFLSNDPDADADCPDGNQLIRCEKGDFINEEAMDALQAEEIEKIHKYLNGYISENQMIDLLDDRDRTTKNLLLYHANLADVQTAVSIMIVLGMDRMKNIQIEQYRQEQWFYNYIELLNSFHLWTVATSIITLSHLPNINNMNQESTNISLRCGTCGKLNHGSGPFICKNCSIETCVCAVCSETVYGLYVWCEGCSHGGHLLHLLDWFQERRDCRTCGHLCEYK